VATLFETLTAGARPIFYDVYGADAIYTQGATIKTIRFIQANPADRMRKEEEAAIWAEYIEWVCKTADLGGLIPTRGDTIEIGSSVWRVLSPEGMPVYEFIDPESIEVRIYTKRIE
jgi:hypothetical protein